MSDGVPERKEGSSSIGGPVSVTAEAPAQYAVEIVRMAMYDIGRSIDLKMAASLLPGTPGMRVVRRRDTPESLMMPAPLCVDLRTGPQKAFVDDSVEGLSVAARIYDEGVLSIIMRLHVNASLEDLHGIEHRRLSANISNLDTYLDDRYLAVFDILKPAVSQEHYSVQKPERETYMAFCFADVAETPALFLEKNGLALTTLLSGEPYNAKLHPSQVRKTLSNPFSYSETDIAVFDMDRCLILDPDRDYEDLLLICEIANYQFLELRSLDRLLDRWLDEAEDDIRAIYTKRRETKIRSRSLQKKFAVIQSLRLDALFILENMENSSKIIGDYFLGVLYEHLCGIFNTAGWTRSVERRLDALQNLYDIVKTEKNERQTLHLEIIFIAVCIIFPVVQILQVMISK